MSGTNLGYHTLLPKLTYSTKLRFELLTFLKFPALLRTRTTQIVVMSSYMTSVAAAAATIRNGVVYTATGGTGRKCL